jgi:hypothetical protein
MGTVSTLDCPCVAGREFKDSSTLDYAYASADDVPVVLICPDVKAAQQALNLVQEWAVDF